jgi:hypothetical protein
MPPPEAHVGAVLQMWRTVQGVDVQRRGACWPFRAAGHPVGGAPEELRRAAQDSGRRTPIASAEVQCKCPRPHGGRWEQTAVQEVRAVKQ